jgi:hypothetical protein
MKFGKIYLPESIRNLRYKSSLEALKNLEAHMARVEDRVSVEYPESLPRFAVLHFELQQFIKSLGSRPVRR